MPEENSLKREFRIDSSDSARPPATLDSETAAYAQGLKAKKRKITDVSYEELDETVPRGKDLPFAQLILKTVTYDDGMTIDTTVGEDNFEYKQYLLGKSKETEGSTVSTRKHTPKKKPAKPAGRKG